ncbi:hypothetical protein HMPREF9098_0859 [Kingella denitrificans ATCC 33394]|uniref:Uncharacterized protein n=1 Tax=Kingella denitrificans ATCC 33394 TaxID=888741 RepID=F0EYC5_9NEIS|nr:hypothetical protein HMPREF9098_0859 [Kingella denitrificans ATCC 33394]
MCGNAVLPVSGCLKHKNARFGRYRARFRAFGADFRHGKSGRGCLPLSVRFFAFKHL